MRHFTRFENAPILIPRGTPQPNRDPPAFPRRRASPRATTTDPLTALSFARDRPNRFARTLLVEGKSNNKQQRKRPHPHRGTEHDGPHALHRVLQQPRRRWQDLHGLSNRLRDRQGETRQEGARPGLLPLLRHHRAAPRRFRARGIWSPDEGSSGDGGEHHRGHSRRGAHPRPRARHGYRRARRRRGEEGRQHLRSLLRQEEGPVDGDGRFAKLPHPPRRSQRGDPR